MSVSAVGFRTDSVTPISDDDIRRIGELARETLPDWWRRFAREREMTLTEADIVDLLAMDAVMFPRAAEQDALRNNET